MRTFYGASKEQRIAGRRLFMPKTTSARIALKSGAAVAYLYEQADRFYAVAFRGTAAKPEFHNSFRTAERRAQVVRAFLESVTASAERKQTERAKKAAWTNPLKVGEILYTSWGYDQTNTEFYIVTRVSGRRTWVARIAADGESTGFMQDRIWPAMPIRIVSEETMHTAQPSGESVYVKISDCIHAWPETGRAHSTSSYA